MYLDFFHTTLARRLPRMLVAIMGLSLCYFVQADDRSDTSNNSGWVEEELNSPTEWLEQAVVPITRWMERSIQGERKSTGSIADIPLQQDVPKELIPPQEAARLLLLLFPGDVLRVQLLATAPPVYVIKLLSSDGNISSFYLDARDGTLLEEMPPMPESDSTSLTTPFAPEIPDENINR